MRDVVDSQSAHTCKRLLPFLATEGLPSPLLTAGSLLSMMNWIPMAEPAGFIPPFAQRHCSELSVPYCHAMGFHVRFAEGKTDTACAWSRRASAP